MQKKKYYASRKQMIPLAIFAGILTCPFWAATMLLILEMFEWKNGLKSLFSLFLVTPLGFIAYFFSNKAIQIFSNQRPILTLSQDMIRSIDFKGRVIIKKHIKIPEIYEVELKKTLLDRQYYLLFIMKDNSKQKLNVGLGFMKNEDVLDLKQQLDKRISAKAKHIQ